MGKGANGRKNGRVPKRGISEREWAQLQKYLKRRNRIVVISAICVAVIAVLAVSGLVYYNSRNKEDSLYAASSASYKLTKAHFSYFLLENYNTFATNNYSNLESYNLNIEKSLKEQEYKDGVTWFDYFADETKITLKELLTMAEAARNAGFSLDDGEKTEIDRNITLLENAGAEQRYSLENYIKLLYGTYVTERDVRECMELSLLAHRYYLTVNDAFTYSEDEYIKCRESNPERFLKCDYIGYSFSYNAEEGADDEEIAEKKAECKANAEALAKCGGVDIFKSELAKYMIEKYDDATEEEAIKTINENIVLGKEYTTESDFGKWAFTEGRKAGDCTVFEEDDEYTVYCLVSEPYFDEYTTKNVRHILITSESYGSVMAAMTKAYDIAGEWSAGDKSADSFAALAYQYSEDADSSANGGLYENVLKDTMLEDLNAWAFDEARKSGEIKVIKTENDYHILYFEGEGKIAWRFIAESLMKAESYSNLFKEYEAIYSVEFSDAVINEIDA